MEVIGYSCIAAAVTAITVTLILRRVLRGDLRRRYPAAASCAVSFLAGYSLLPSWAALVPSRGWHWLPYVSLVAMLVGPVALATGLHWFERSLLKAILALLAAFLLVPTWADLEPSRWVYVPAVAGYLFALMVLLDRLPRRVSPSIFGGLLLISAGTVALLSLYAVSVTYGGVGLIATSALGGWFGARLFVKSEERSTSRAATAALNCRGLIPTFVVLVGGVAFTSYVSPRPPLPGMLLVPAAPLAMWLGSWSPHYRQRMTVTIIQIVAAVAVVGLAVGLVSWQLSGTESDGY